MKYSHAVITAVVAIAGCVEPPPQLKVTPADSGTSSVPDAERFTDSRAPIDHGRSVARDMGPIPDTSRDATLDMPDDADVRPMRDGGADAGARPDAAEDVDVGADAGTPVDFTGLVFLLIVADQTTLLAGELSLVAYLEGEGAAVTMVNDENASQAVGSDADLVIMTRSTSSGAVGSALRPLAIPLVHWEYAMQWSDRLGTTSISSMAPVGTQTTGDTIVVDSAAPAELRCGFDTDLVFYPNGPAELTFADTTLLGADAHRVATTKADPTQVVYYAYDRGTTLADGTTAEGPRVYFGVGRDEFGNVSSEGLALFRCALQWAIGR